MVAWPKCAMIIRLIFCYSKSAGFARNTVRDYDHCTSKWNSNAPLAISNFVVPETLWTTDTTAIW
jgi:hypothetical protein